MRLTVDGRDDLGYIMQFAYDETFEGRTLKDITDEEAQVLGEQWAQAYPDPQFEHYIDEETDTAMLAVTNGTYSDAAIWTTMSFDE